MQASRDDKENNIFIWLFILISLTTYNFYSEENSINHFLKSKKLKFLEYQI